MYKVLIADDEALLRQGLHYIVDWNALDFCITNEASNGIDALNLVLKEHPDVLLIDIRMPKLSGLKVIKQARENGYQGKIIILSGYSDFKYAQEAIKQGVQFYLSKPVEEDELTEILNVIHDQLDKESTQNLVVNQYRENARETIIKNILTTSNATLNLDLRDLNLLSPIYQVVICEKYSHHLSDISYLFSDLLLLTNENHDSYDRITLDNHEVILLKGDFALRKFVDFLSRYERELKPQKGSPLHSLFITFGRRATTIETIHYSYEDASKLLQRRFFCEQEQHTIGYDELPILEENTSFITPTTLNQYAEELLNYLQAFNRNRVAETLHHLMTNLYHANDTIYSIKLFLTDLYLQIKEKIYHLYSGVNIPFPSNAWIIDFIGTRYYLYEIILFFTEQFEMIMNAIGNSSRESILDDIHYYIKHNYTENIKLENIAPLFGYNPSYLGKIFKQKTGQSFNTYVDYVRIKQSKILLEQDNLKVYEIAEKVGYKTVDYFHIKFKKYVGTTPAEYRKQAQNSSSLAH